MKDIKPMPPEGFSSYYSFAVSLLRERDKKLERELQELLEKRKRRAKRDRLISLGILSLWVIIIIIYLVK